MSTQLPSSGGGDRTRLILGALAVVAVVLLSIWILGRRENTSTTAPGPTTTPFVVTTMEAAVTVPAQPTPAGPPTADVLATEAPTAEPAVAPPQAAISGPATGSVGQPLAFDGRGSTSQAPIVSYAWDMGDGSRASSAQVVHAYDLAGTYLVVLTVMDEARQIASARQVVTIAAVPSKPPSAVISGATAAQVGETVTFNASASVAGDAPIQRYDWNFGDGGTASGDTVSHAYSQPGTYHVVLNVLDGNGLGDTATQTVQITTASKPQAVISGPTQAKVGQMLSFDAGGSTAGSPIVSYLWSFGDGGTSNAVVAKYAYDQAGSYPVTLRITDQTGASSTAQQPVTVAADAARPPTAAFSGPSDALVNETVTFDAGGSRPGSSAIRLYTWSVNGVTVALSGATLTYSFTSPGTYVVGLILTDQNGLSDSTSQEITVRPNLDGVVWTLDGSAPPITLTAANGSGSGSAGCNTYNVSYTVSGNAMTGSVTVTGLTNTQRVCSDAEMAAEQAYLTTLQAVTSYTINASRLSLSGPGGTLNFTAR